jgi:hypothetical protein
MLPKMAFACAMEVDLKYTNVTRIVTIVSAHPTNLGT